MVQQRRSEALNGGGLGAGGSEASGVDEKPSHDGLPPPRDGPAAPAQGAFNVTSESRVLSITLYVEQVKSALYECGCRRLQNRVERYRM